MERVHFPVLLQYNKEIAWVRHRLTFAGLVIVFDYDQLLEEDSAADVSSSVQENIDISSWNIIISYWNSAASSLIASAPWT